MRFFNGDSGVSGGGSGGTGAGGGASAGGASGGGSGAAAGGGGSAAANGNAVADSGAGAGQPAATGGVPSAAASQSSSFDYDSFSWDTWDGNVEAFPEDQRKIAQRFTDYYGKRYADYEKYKTEASNVARVQALYDSALESLDGNDPRVAEWEQKYNELNTRFNETTGKYDTLSKEAQTYETRIKEMQMAHDAKLQKLVEIQAQQAAEQLWQKHPAYFDDTPKAAKLGALLEAGFDDPEQAIEIIERGGAAYELAVKLAAKGAATPVIMEAVGALGTGKTKPPPTAPAVAGTNPVASPSPQGKEPRHASTKQEALRLAIDRNFPTR